jgi:pyrroline-5-carboxylate reductase
MSPLAGKRFGFLGAGVIAEVLIRRLLGSKVAEPENILAYDITGPILERLAMTFLVRAMGSNSEVVNGSDFVFLAVPPMAVVPVLKEVADSVREDQLVFSLAAGVSTKLMETSIGKPVPLVRLIPNTPSWIGEGMNPLPWNSRRSDGSRDDAEAPRGLREIGGDSRRADGHRHSSDRGRPKYVFPVIAALADAAIAHDLPPAVALPAACQVVAGAAALVAETERSPASLSLMISARTLDEAAVRKLFTQAVKDSHERILALEARVAAEKGMPI